MTPVLAGALAGLLHVVSGPDHLVAVAPLAIHKPGLGIRVGVSWGLGHATGVIALGLIGVVARSVIPLKRISSWSEVLVGGALIGIGVWALWQSRNMVLHRHAHAHDDPTVSEAHPAHEHLHVHVANQPHTPAAHLHHMRSAYVVGALHGAAGTGHLFGVIPALALRPAQGLMYLLAYAVAAVGGMASFGAALGSIGHRIVPRHLSIMMRICGGLAIGLGVYWIVAGWP
jgi:hypothetical protein